MQSLPTKKSSISDAFFYERYPVCNGMLIYFDSDIPSVTEVLGFTCHLAAPSVQVSFICRGSSCVQAVRTALAGLQNPKDADLETIQKLSLNGPDISSHFKMLSEDLKTSKGKHAKQRLQKVNRAHLFNKRRKATGSPLSLEY